MKRNRRNWLKQLSLSITGMALAGLKTFAASTPKHIKTGDKTKLGAFSISLTVKDLTVSKQFYENLGFKVLGGAMNMNYLIMKNEHTLIGLFHGMFEKNMLTFNPG